MPRDVEVSFLPMECVGTDGRLLLDRTKTLAEGWQGFTYFRDGDVLVAKITPCFENGKGAFCEGLSNGLGFGTTELHVIRPGALVNGRFLFYLTINHAFRVLGTTSMSGAAGQQRISQQFIADFVIGLPDPVEQRGIARFLDRETAKIDALIAKMQQLIELLHEKRTALISHAVSKGLDPGVPMKESGIDSLDQIPEDWELLSVRRFATAVEQGWSPVAEDRQAEDEEWAVIKLSAIHKGNFRSSEHKALPKDLVPERRYEIRDRDFLITRSNTPDLVGDVCVVDSPRSGLMLCDLVYRVQVDEERIDKRFLSYSMLSRFGRHQITAEARGSSQSMVKIAQSHVRSLTIVAPRKGEQQTIVRFLDESTGRIDRLALKVSDGIEKLREYRTALISAAVTGKIDVRGEAPDEPEEL